MIMTVIMGLGPLITIVMIILVIFVARINFMSFMMLIWFALGNMCTFMRAEVEVFCPLVLVFLSVIVLMPEPMRKPSSWF